VNNPKKIKTKIKKVVVLCLENRSFDHMFGFLDNVNGVKDLNREEIFDFEGVSYNDLAEYIHIVDPGHEVPHTKLQLDGLVNKFIKKVCYRLNQ
jgi:phospholipase C